MKKIVQEVMSQLHAIAAAISTAVNDGQMTRGDIGVHTHDEATGEVTYKQFRNLTVTAGKVLMAAALVGATAASITHMAMGTGATAVAVGQTALVTENARVAVTSATASGAVATAVATFGAGVGTATINEIGLFNASSAGTMVARALTGAIVKGATMAITFTWTITFS